MAKLKGITPIIAILVLLLITVAIAGAAWIYITQYVSQTTNKVLETTSSECSAGGVVVFVRNSGTGTVTFSSDLILSRDVTSGAGNCITATSVNPIITTVAGATITSIAPGQAGMLNDTACDSQGTNRGAIRYRLIVAGRVATLNINC